MKPAPCIGLVDDDPAMLRALRRLLTAEGFAVKTWASAHDLLSAMPGALPDCLVLDVQMPGLNGFDLKERLAAGGAAIPVVFLTGQGDIPMAVQAMKGGAVNFLTKPVEDEALLAAVRAAVDIAARQRDSDRQLADARKRFSTLTPREREVLTHIITGRLNKQIAADLGASEQTIKVHRMRVLSKMGVPSVADLVRLAQRLRIEPASPH